MNKSVKKYFIEMILVGVLLLLQLVLLTNTTFTAWPEMSFWPYLFLKGWLPYRDIAIAHTPLLLIDLSIFYKLFGVGILQLKVFTWFYILVIDLVLYFVVRVLWNKKYALVSLVIYIILQFLFDGNGMWFDLALTPYGLLVYYLIQKKRYLAAGWIFSFALLTKQTAFWFLPAITFQIVESYNFSVKRSISAFGKFILGLFEAGLVFFLILSLFGILADFIDWTFIFGVGYLPTASGQMLLPSMKQAILALFPFLFILLMLLTNKKRAFSGYHLAVWTIMGLMGVFPRWEYFHFQPALPFLAITATYVLSLVKEFEKKYLIALLAVGIIFTSFVLIKSPTVDWGGKTRFYEPQVAEVVDYVVKENPNSLLILNYWDNVYTLTNKTPSFKPWIPYLPWYMEYRSYKSQYINGFINKRPEMVVFGEYDHSFLGSYKIEEVDKILSRYYFVVKRIGDNILVYKLNQ